ncbi:maleate cis-trans isomerase family protein [Williamsia sterculiae]|uniref:Maleate isomerase n=1 Tax=Williamsia sterculiae TaxID=1344003 RepID=A0A1N7GI92_9NOCA|nr:aspartate/glutamate racemase family protein [Williamsia sterculiae]SIS12297.1 maleate isomerase [Williamsia sterculiae]
MTTLGMIVPSSNTTVEDVTRRLLDRRDDVSVVATRVRVQSIGLDDDGADFDVETILDAARLLADARVDVIVWNATAGSWLGADHDAVICTAITDATGVPAVTATQAILAACRVFGVGALGLATPYTPDVVEAIVAEYARHGVAVTAHAEWGERDNYSFAMRPSRDVVDLLRRAVAAGEVQAVALVCTNVDGTTAVDEVEAELSTPVIDSIAATVWWSLEAAGVPARIEGHGTLLAQASFRRRALAVVTELRERTGSDRTTVRVDDPTLGLHVDLCAAESCAAHVRSIQHDPSLDQRALNTVRWLEENRRLLVQPAFTEAPHPPQALRDVYGVRAQVLGPVELDGDIRAWLSVHSLRERPWSTDDLTAVDTAREAITALLGETRGLTVDA